LVKLVEVVSFDGILCVGFKIAAVKFLANAFAVMFSIFKTTKENGLNPFEYLTYIFRTAPNLKLKEHPEKVVKLLPDAVPEAVRVQNWRSPDEN
jgi:hypothetical protein